MDFKYTLDPTADIPIMLINKHIGTNAEDGEGIMGDQFTRELMFLDTLNKKSIEVWINSGGGVVTEGEQIFHAMLTSKTPVDTVCTGTAASIAGPLFVAGRNRTMLDFSKLMMHPVSGGDEKSTKAFEQSIRTMLSSRSFLTDDAVKKLMDRTTWIFPTECEQMGLCNKVDPSHGLNINSINPETATFKEYSKITNKLIENHKKTPMRKVTNKLNLVDGSNEDAIYNAIEANEAKFKAELAENKSKFDKYVDEMSTAKAEFDKATSKYNELKAKYDVMEEESNKLNEANELAKCDALKNEAKLEIENAVKLGKIENKAEVIEKMTEQYVLNAGLTKEILNSIPAKVYGAKFNVTNSNKSANTFTAMDINNQMAEKLKNKQ